MGILEAVARAVESFVERSDDLTDPQAAAVITARQVPDIYATNESLSVWGAVRAAIDQNIVPIVVFENRNGRNQRHQGPVLGSIIEMAHGRNKAPRVVIREPHESVEEAIDRARANLHLPVAGVIVGYPPGHRRSDNGLTYPQHLRQHFMADPNRRSDLPIVAAYADANLHRDERLTVTNNFGQSVRSQLDLDAAVLAQYNVVTTPSERLRKDLTARIGARIDPAFMGAYELVDDEGALKVITVPIPHARYVTHETSPEIRNELSASLGAMLSIDTLQRSEDLGLSRGLGHELPTSLPTTQSSYTLGA